MISLSAVARELSRAGLSGEALVDALARIESESMRTADIRSSGAIRQARYRAKKGASLVTLRDADDVTGDAKRNGSDGCDVTGDATPRAPVNGSSTTSENTRVISKKENPPKGGQKKGASREDFERFKAVYPRRKGSNPTEPAWQKFDAAVRSGEDPEAIIAAAQRYGAEEASLGHAGTPFVKQMQVWLNQKCWRDYPEPSVVEQLAVCPGTVRIKRTDQRWEFFAARYRRDHQGRAPPVTDESWYFPEEWLREVEAGTAA
jgi:hypothetical protein